MSCRTAGSLDAAARPVLFINPNSGGGSAARADVPQRARERGIEVSSSLPVSVWPTVDDAVASGADALGIAGGDGSMAVVATAALAHGLPFICVPAGTRNHFALDLGLDPRDPVGALDAFTDAIERRIDVRQVERPRLPEQRLARCLRRRCAPARLPRCEVPHAARDRAHTARPECGGAGPAPRRRSRPRPRDLRGRSRLQQPVLAGPAAVAREPPTLTRRTAGGHRGRRPAHGRARPRPSVDRDPRARGGLGDRARRDRRRGGRCSSRRSSSRSALPRCASGCLLPRRGDHPERVMTAHPAGPKTAYAVRPAAEPDNRQTTRSQAPESETHRSGASRPRRTDAGSSSPRTSRRCSPAIAAGG